jgi:hypothetical protein
MERVRSVYLSRNLIISGDFLEGSAIFFITQNFYLFKGVQECARVIIQLDSHFAWARVVVPVTNDDTSQGRVVVISVWWVYLDISSDLYYYITLWLFSQELFALMISKSRRKLWTFIDG